MDEKFSNDHADNDCRHPHDNLESCPAIWRVLGRHKREALAHHWDETFLLAVCHRILGINEEVAERHKIRNEEAEIGMLEVKTRKVLKQLSIIHCYYNTHLLMKCPF